MNMFCYQCQETAKNEGCAKSGTCGKKPETAKLQDLLVYVLKGISVSRGALADLGKADDGAGPFVTSGLFTTVTNVSFDDATISSLIEEGLALKTRLNESLKAAGGDPSSLHECATWTAPPSDFAAKAPTVGVLSTEDPDVRSLRELLVYGVKGIAAYYHHATVLGHTDADVEAFLMNALASTTETLTTDEMVGYVLKAGEVAVTTMALLDTANTSTYGNPEITEVDLGVRANPGILISGHDLKDLEQLLEQTSDSGVDVYTHGEMLPAQYYPAFKKHAHFAGNYGGAWYEQKEQFESFNGPILMTTNCLVPPRESYKDRLYTTGVVGFPGVAHIDEVDGAKDFSPLIEKAKACAPPVELETGKIVGGFAHAQVMALADKVVEAVKSGAVKKFVVMAGCDGRQSSRGYFTDIAKGLPEDTIILTAGCAKYRYNKLGLGDIGGIPRVLDAGQCNDSYSLAVIALKLKEVFGLEDINDLPLEFDVAWYEQKAVTVLLALLHLGFKGVRIGPTLPVFLSPSVAKTLVEAFDLKVTADVESDLKALTA